MTDPDPLLLKLADVAKGEPARSSLRAWMDERWEGLEPIVRDAMKRGAPPWEAWAGAWCKAGHLHSDPAAWAPENRDQGWARDARRRAGQTARTTYYRVRRERKAANAPVAGQKPAAVARPVREPPPAAARPDDGAMGADEIERLLRREAAGRSGEG